MTTSTATTSVNTETEVAAPIEHTFDVFTAGIGSWWDPGHHILAAPLAEMEFEPFVGGNIIDRGTDGSECRWARVLAYEPPHRVVFSWDINTRWELETDPARTSEVEIAFTELAPGRTQVVLTHRHLDRHGEGWEGMRDAVSSGWSLAHFGEVAEQAFTDANNHVRGSTLPTITDDTMHTRIAAAASYTAVVLRTTARFVRPDVDRLVWEHGRRNMALVDAGLLSIVLPVNDDSDVAGFAVFAATPEETEQIMAGDPAVRAGIFGYDIHPVRGFPGSALP